MSESTDTPAITFGRPVQALINKGREIAQGLGEHYSSLLQAYQELAGVFVKLRKTCKTKEKAPDFQGRSQTYRAAVGEILSAVSTSDEERNRIRSAVNYHVRQMLIADGLLPKPESKPARSTNGEGESSSTVVSPSDVSTDDQGDPIFWMSSALSSLTSAFALVSDQGKSLTAIPRLVKMANQSRELTAQILMAIGERKGRKAA